MAVRYVNRRTHRGVDIMLRWCASSAAMHRFLALQLKTSHVAARTLCPVGKYSVRPDCTLKSTTHRVISGSPTPHNAS